MTFSRVKSELRRWGKGEQAGSVKILLAVVWRTHGGRENRRVEEGTSEEGRRNGELQDGGGSRGQREMQYTTISLAVGLREEARKTSSWVASVPGRMVRLSS